MVSTTLPVGPAATAAGVSGLGATLLDTAVDAWLVINRNNIGTLAAKFNQITDSGMIPYAGNNVFAGIA